MNCPWFWYLHRDIMSGDLYVIIHAAKKDSVRGRFWGQRFDTGDAVWTLYFEPRWMHEYRDSNVPIEAATVNCEWVCVKRERR